MATYTSEAYNGYTIVRGNQQGPFEASFSVEIPAGTNLASGDVFNFCRVGPGVRLSRYAIQSSVLDDTTGVTIDFTTDTPENILANSTIGQTGGVTAEAAPSAYTVQTSGYRTILGTVDTVPTTQTVAGTTTRTITFTGKFIQNYDAGIPYTPPLAS